MNRLKFYTMVLSAFLFFQGCSQVLEPVLMQAGSKSKKVLVKEEFNIDIASLTYAKASEANKDPYPRKLMLTGSGSRANVFDEAEFLTSEIPKSFLINDYKLSTHDILLFNMVYEYEENDLKLPENLKLEEYILGIGDQLEFVYFVKKDNPLELDGVTGAIKNVVNTDTELVVSQTNISSNGNILLLGIGTLKAAGLTLDELRSEVLNVMIRNGQSPDFQLEIKDFLSQRAFITSNLRNNGQDNVIKINNIPLSLKELALLTGLSNQNNVSALVKLTRNNKIYRFNSRQLFDLESKEIFIQDGDQIDIQAYDKDSVATKLSVDSDGYILMPNLGKVSVLDRTLNEVKEDVRAGLRKIGLKPTFQLDILNHENKKIFLIQKNVGSQVVPLTSSDLTLREFILSLKNVAAPSNGITIITLKRNKNTYRLPLDKILNPNTDDIWMQNDDHIEIENIIYKPGQVYALSGSSSASILAIDPSQRETLANVLFTPGGAFSNDRVKRSEIYLLRGRNPSVAYHLDGQNVSKILIAANTELRPNDIIYVAERPIISFNRLLSEITPLRILFRDIQAGEIP